MERIDKSVEVHCPVRTAYNQWTQFEDFPHFMAGVKEVRQIDDVHLHWRVEVNGRRHEWVAEITEQTPDKRISWRSIQGVRNAGTVRFEALEENRTLVHLTMAYVPEGPLEYIGDALGVTSMQVQESIDGFKAFIEARERETGAWRGAIHDAQVTTGARDLKS